MKHFQAETLIAAPAAKIWAILSDPAGYPEWDPGMVRVEGQLSPGQQVKFFTKFSPERAFAVKVTNFEPPHKMVFTGGMPLGLFKSERVHTLTAKGDDQTHFHTAETFSGLLLPVFGRTLPDLTDSFVAFCAGLKGRAENS